MLSLLREPLETSCQGIKMKQTAVCGQLPCEEGFKPGQPHIQNKFCSTCREGFAISGAYLRCIPPELLPFFTNTTRAGFWNMPNPMKPQPLHQVPYRVINQHLRCQGNLLHDRATRNVSMRWLQRASPIAFCLHLLQLNRTPHLPQPTRTIPQDGACAGHHDQHRVQRRPCIGARGLGSEQHQHQHQRCQPIEAVLYDVDTKRVAHATSQLSQFKCLLRSNLLAI